MRSSVGARGEALGDLGKWKGFGTAAVGKAAGSDRAKYQAGKPRLQGCVEGAAVFCGLSLQCSLSTYFLQLGGRNRKRAVV